MGAGPTIMQWRCLVAFHRHHGNAAAAAHSCGVSYWAWRSNIRRLLDRMGWEDIADASLFYAEELRHAIGQSRGRRTPRREPDQPTLGLSA